MTTSASQFVSLTLVICTFSIILCTGSNWCLYKHYMSCTDIKENIILSQEARESFHIIQLVMFMLECLLIFLFLKAHNLYSFTRILLLQSSFMHTTFGWLVFLVEFFRTYDIHIFFFFMKCLSCFWFNQFCLVNNIAQISYFIHRFSMLFQIWWYSFIVYIKYGL